MITAETLRALLALVEEAKGPSRLLDATLECAVRAPHLRPAKPGDHYGRNLDPSPGHIRTESGFRVSEELTADISKARALAREALPYFWMSSGLCSLTGHASIGPDYNGPAGERLRDEWPEADFHSGFHADLAPGDGPHRECYAILSCMLKALLAKEGLAASAARSFVEKSVKEAGHGE